MLAIYLQKFEQHRYDNIPIALATALYRYCFQSYAYTHSQNRLLVPVAQVALESELIVVEEVLHSTNICVVVTSGTVTVTSALTLSTLGDSATRKEIHK